MKLNTAALLFASFHIPCATTSFVWDFYVKKYNLPRNYQFDTALDHYIQHIIKKPATSPYQLHNTNFDWQYYTAHNNIPHCNTEREAFIHYRSQGEKQQLPYCEHFNIHICIHLGNVSKLEYILNEVRFFMRNNPCNTFSISCAIPVCDENIAHIKKNNAIMGTFPNIDASTETYVTKIKKYCPCEDFFITAHNAIELHALKHYIKKELALSKEHLHISFIENRGMDIGSFLLQLEHLKKQPTKPDFIIKIHSKTLSGWADILFSIVRIKINRLLRLYDAVYTCVVQFPDYYMTKEKTTCLIDEVKKITNAPQGFPEKFNFCAGTMFIVSGKILDYTDTWDFKKLFYALPQGRLDYHHYAHAFERYFGGIMDHLHMRVCHIGHYTKDVRTVFGTFDTFL
jgi:hypothetical protein